MIMGNPDDRKAPRLGVIMIVKDEEDHLPLVLEDISSVVDEIVVVDTGSADRTPEIARSFGVKLGTFTWCDDFSAARNVSIRLAGADYLLWLDADDRIDEQARKGLLELKDSLDPRKRTAYFLKIFNTAADHTHTLSFQLRIFPNLEGVRFQGRLHEQVAPSLEAIAGMGFRKADITIRHTGYHDEGLVEKKGRRNLAIQLQELAQGNDSALQHFFIAMSYHAAREYGKCWEYIQEARRRSTEGNWYKYSFNLSTECLMKLGRIEESIREAQKGVELFPGSGTMLYNLGAMHFRAEHWDEAISCLRASARLGMDIDTFPTPPNIAATLQQYLGMALEKTGKRDEAINAYRESVLINPDWYPSLKLLGLALVSSGCIEEAVTRLERAFECSDHADLQLNLSLGRLLRSKGRTGDAHRVYLDTLEYFPDHPQVLAGLAVTSVILEDVERLLRSLESLMQQLGLDTDREIDGNEEFASICIETGRALFGKGEQAAAAGLAEAAGLLDANCWQAHLLVSDTALADRDSRLALTALEKALHAGAPAGELEQRMALLEKNS